MAAIIAWYVCVFGSIGVVAWAVRLAGKDMRWVGQHLFVLIMAAGALAFSTAGAGSKPGPGPGPEPPDPTPARTNDVIRISVGRRADGTILPYGAPIRETSDVN